MKNLQLSLKTQWFEMTKAGIKKEDYREITPYWLTRLVGYSGSKESKSIVCRALVLEHSISREWLNLGYSKFKDFNKNVMTLDYPNAANKDRILKLEHKGIEIREGNPDWGAEPGVLYFCIKHGEILP